MNLLVTALFLPLILLAEPPEGASAPEPTTVSGVPAVVVFEAGTDSYSHIRIPSLVTLADGTLLAFAEGRAGGDHAKNDIILKRSTDGGDTWGPLQVLDDQGGDSLNDPMAVEIRRGPNTGRVLLFYMSFPEGCHTNCVEPGYGPRSSRNWVIQSDDRGRTWSTPRDVTEIVRRPTSSFAGSPGIGIQLERGDHAGRLVIPYREGPLSRVRIYMLYSDDGGSTWRRGELVDDGTDGGGGVEVAVAALADGTLVLNARGHNGAPKSRKIARSTDGGVTWTPLSNDPAIPSPHCMASIIPFAVDSEAGPRTGLLYAGPWSPTRRALGSISVSDASGEDWSGPVEVVPGGFAYSQLSMTGPGEVGLLFEGAGYARIGLLRLDLDTILKQADRAADASKTP
ncbi:MAG: sialidase family protein [Phycisphaerales bacterium]|nr:sialidase family protein [Phycisphaerales bacterium]